MIILFDSIKLLQIIRYISLLFLDMKSTDYVSLFYFPIGSNVPHVFALDFEKNPTHLNANYGLSIAAEPMEIVYHKVRSYRFIFITIWNNF